MRTGVFKKHSKTRLFGLIGTVSVLVVCGLIYQFVSRAATPAVSTQPESGILSAPAARVTDVAASGGAAVRFTAPPPPPIASPPAVPPAPPAGINRSKGIAARYYGRPANVNFKRLEALRTNWYYNWTPAPPSGTTYMEFVPMLWGASSVTTANIDALKAGKASGKYKHLLAFNEPNGVNQADMTVDQAIALWPKLQSTGLRLVSPAPTTTTSTTNTSTPGVAWIDDFMTKALAKGYRVDVIALHYYGDWTNPNLVSSASGIHSTGSPPWRSARASSIVSGPFWSLYA